MKKIAIIFSIIFVIVSAVYFIFFTPEKYEESDMLEEILQRGKIRVGINLGSKPFGFLDSEYKVCGYDADMGRYIAQYLLQNPNNVEFIPVTPSNRMLKASTGEVDIVIATMTITPSRKEIINFSIPYDSAGQAVLVKTNSKIATISDLAGLNVGVIFGTTAEKNMKTLVPTANILGFKNYLDAYKALKAGQIDAITSDDTILSRFIFEDKNVKLLPKRYSKEPYGIAFKKGKGTKKFEEKLNFAISDMKRKKVIARLHKKWLG